MHDHTQIYLNAFAPREEFSFHSKLREWLVQYWDLKDTETVFIQEIGCAENSCPVYETLVVASEHANLKDVESFLQSSNNHAEVDSALNMRILKLGKAKHLLTKQDIYFSVEKQKQ